MIKSFKKIIYVAGFSILTACGGDNGNVTPAIEPISVAPLINAKPVANPGADQYVFVGTAVTLDGGASSDGNGDVLTYKWSLLSGPVGSTAVLSNNKNVRSVFNADIAGIYSAALVVSDGKTESQPENVTIVAMPNTVISSIGLIANGGQNQNVSVGNSVNLNGSLSADVKGRVLSHNWTLITKPVGSTAILSEPNGKSSKFVADVIGLYGVSLYVSAGNDKSLPVSVFVTATSSGAGINLAPVANAGSDQSASIAAVISLDGGLSTDSNGDMLTYLWSFQSKPVMSGASLSVSTSKIPKFTADVAGTYELALVVNDGKLNSQTDVISVIIRSSGVIDIADTGLYKCSNISKNLALSLFTQGHTYLDRDHDGKPCEANDILNEYVSVPTTVPNSSGKKCYVSGYYRKSGTYVKGYYRSC